MVSDRRRGKRGLRQERATERAEFKKEMTDERAELEKEKSEFATEQDQLKTENAALRTELDVRTVRLPRYQYNSLSFQTTLLFICGSVDGSCDSIPSTRSSLPWQLSLMIVIDVVYLYNRYVFILWWRTGSSLVPVIFNIHRLDAIRVHQSKVMQK